MALVEGVYDTQDSLMGDNQQLDIETRRLLLEYEVEEESIVSLSIPARDVSPFR